MEPLGQGGALHLDLEYALRGLKWFLMLIGYWGLMVWCLKASFAVAVTLTW